ncbi:replication-relaxation family protein [Metabacillus herbersteinensis]|uniref:Replication-relaxation family protein n=1 Tax=Metabacillus herbersteinensis TaxID=283816 RepID=A0ABV6GJ95_9BACI
MVKKRHTFGPNRQGVFLSEEDMYLLTTIAEQRLLTTEQIHQYHSTVSKMKIDALRVKLIRWKRYNIVHSHEYSLGQKGCRFNYYRIGFNGIKVLIEEGKIPKSWKDIEISKFSSTKNIEHFLATQEVVVKGITSIKNISSDIKSQNPYYYPYVDTASKSRLIVPDWILKNGNLHLNIEMDTGTESIQELQMKVKSYIEYCELNPDQEHIVLIVILDDTFLTRNKYGDDRSRRVGNLKKLLINTPGLQLANLSVYVLPLKRISDTIGNLLHGLKPDSVRNKIEYALSVGKVLGELNNNFEYNIEIVQDNLVFPPDIKKEIKPDGVIKLSNTSGTFNEFVFLHLMDEGNVKDIHVLNNLSNAIAEDIYKIKINRIIAFYKKTEERINDVIGTEYENVLLGDFNEWTNSLNSEPVFYKFISPYRMEDCTYEGQ